MKLSIITINLNDRNGLKRTIESVVSQTFADFEYIVIDGDSTDGSAEVIKEYSEKISYWTSEPDKGIYNAMNKGIVQAKGDYCLFLNSGDALYRKTVLEEVFNQNFSEDIVIGNLMNYYPEKGIEKKRRPHRRAKDGEKQTLFDFFTEFIPHQATFIRRKLFEQYGLYDEQYKIISDWAFFLKTIIFEGVSVKYIDTVVTSFDMNGIGTQKDYLDFAWQESIKVLEALLPPYILTDYSYFQKINKDFKKMFQYKFTYRIGRAINKMVTLWEIITGK